MNSVFRANLVQGTRSEWEREVGGAIDVHAVGERVAD